MKITALSILAAIYVALSSLTWACDYSFGTITQSVYYPNQTTTPITTLSNCQEYLFKFSINITSTQSPVSDVITVHLPLGIEYVSLNSNPNVSYVSGTGEVVLSLSNWTVGQPLVVEMLCKTPSCIVQGQTANGITFFTGENSCTVTQDVTTSISCYTANVYAVNTETQSTLLKNMGDIGELVFQIQNSSGNGAIISDILATLQNEPSISFVTPFVSQFGYYFSTSSTVPPGNSIYSYVPPSGAILTSLPASQQIPIGPAVWSQFLSHDYLADGEFLYLHIPYQVVSCDNQGIGQYDFSTLCSTTTCATAHAISNIEVSNGTPEMTIATLPYEGLGTYCEEGPQTMKLGYHVTNSPANTSGGPAGYGRAANIDLFVTVSNVFGAIDNTTFTISNGSNVITIPQNLAVQVSNGASTLLNHSIYKIKLTELPVQGSDWMPLGANSLADLDGDGMLDDLLENGGFDIKVEFTYQTASCPFPSDHGVFNVISTIEWNHFDQCGNFVYESAWLNEYNESAGSLGRYVYSTGSLTSLDLPTDVLADESFPATLCFNTSPELFVKDGFEFNCPDGYHRVRLNLATGFHFDYSGLTSSSNNPGWYELPEITAGSACNNGAITQQITPIVQEFCDQGQHFVEVRFGKIQKEATCGGTDDYTFILPCFDIPLSIDCEGISSSACNTAPSNFGFDNFDFVFDFVCDESCSSCAPYLGGSSASTFHHCLGDCDSYFGTNPDFTLTRSEIGFNNPNEAVNPIIDCVNGGTPVTDNTGSTINLKAAYPGDPVALHASGGFYSDPGGGLTPLAGSAFEQMGLQIRYNQIAGVMDYNVFELDDSQPADGFRIYHNGVLFLDIPPQSLDVSTFVDQQIVHMNIDLQQTEKSQLLLGEEYTFEVDLHLRVRVSPVNNSSMFFGSGVSYTLTSLRAEFMGVTNQIRRGSCDDYGAKFKIYQPRVAVNDPAIQLVTCEPYEVEITLLDEGVGYGIMDEFPNEFRSYANLTGPVTAIVPAGFQVTGVSFGQAKTIYSGSGTNEFGSDFYNVDVAVDYTTALDGQGNTIVTMTGTGGHGCWPQADLNQWSQSQIIALKLQATCDAPAVSTMPFAGNYTLSAQQSSPEYQTVVSFNRTATINHYDPSLSLVEPTTQVSALDGTAVFNFQLCTQPPSNPYGIYPLANMAWVAFENSTVNGLDLTNATLTNSTGQTVPFVVYSTGSGQGILANLGTIQASACLNLTLTVHVNENGCVQDGSDPVSDFLNVLFGNSCSGMPLSTPQPECQQGTAVFEFVRYPSRLELLTNAASFSPPVEMCNGILEYHFVLNSAEQGSVVTPEFWLDLPSGITLENIQFAYPAVSPTTTSPVLTSFDNSTYGPNSNLGGWDVLSHLNWSTTPASLPGTISPQNNQVAVTLHLKSSCSYDLSSPINFYTQGVSACGTDLTVQSASHIPEIENATLVNDLTLSSSISYSDGDVLVNCNNTATVTLTITNNSSTANSTDFELVASVPSTLTVNPGTGTLANNEITWDFTAGSIQQGIPTTVTYTVSLTDTFCMYDIPLSASIEFVQEVDCESTGGSCQVVVNTAPTSFEIDACCLDLCNLDLTMSSEPVQCKSSPGSATVAVTGGVGPLTYLWSPGGQTTATATNLFQGTYTVVVTDALGCTESATVVVGTVNNPLTITAIPDNTTICEGESVSFDLGGATTYSVSDGTTIYSSIADPYITTPNTTTTYTFTGYDQFGCSGTTSATITVTPLVETVFHISDTYCEGAVIPELPGSSLNPFSGSWDATVISNTTSGTYTFTPAQGQCGTIYELVVTIIPSPVVTVNSAAICPGGSATLTATGATTYSWTPSSTLSSAVGSSVTATPASTTTYIVTGISNGCSSTAEALVTVYTPVIPTITASGSTVFCSGGSVTLTASVANSYLWSPGNSINQSISVTSSGQYSVTTIDANGCQGTSAVTPVVVFPNPPTPAITPSGPTTFCSGASVDLSAPNASSYLWSNGETTQTIHVTTSGSYSVTVSNIYGCTSTSALMNVTVNPTPVVNVNSATICAGESATLTASGASVYSWTPAGTLSSGTGATVTATPPTTTTYTVIGAIGHCASTAQAVVTVNPIPVMVTPHNRSVCSGATVPAITFSTSTGIPGTWFIWSNNNTSIGLPANGMGNIAPYTAPVNSGSTPIVGTITVTPMANGCAGSPVSFTITIQPRLLMLTPVNRTACPGETLSGINFATLPNVSGTTYNWTNSNTSIGLPSGGTGNIGSYTAPANSGPNSITGTIQVTPSANGCSGNPISFTITIKPSPTVTLPATTNICAGNSATIGITNPPGTYLWSQGPPSGATTQSIVVPAPSGTSPVPYTVTYTAANGCQASATTNVYKQTCTLPLKCNLTANFTTSALTSCVRSFANTSNNLGILIPSNSTAYTYYWQVFNTANGALIATGTTFNLNNVTFPTTGTAVTYTVCLTTTNVANPACFDQTCMNISVTCGSNGLILSTGTHGLKTKFEVNDTEGQPVTANDYMWNFGDDSFSREATPNHTYAKPGTYNVCVILDGDNENSICRTIEVSADETEQTLIPLLSVNPNPTNGETTILLDGVEKRTVEIKLYNMLGEEVTTLFEQTCCNDEMIRILWNSNTVPPGVYLIKAEIDSKAIIEKVVVELH